MNKPPPAAAPDFAAVFAALPGLYLVLDRDFTIVAASDAHLAATMKTRDEVIGRSVFAVYPQNPADSAGGASASLRASLERVLRNRAADVMPMLKYDIERPAGGGGGFVERYWTPTNSPLLGPDGEVTHIINRVEDVTAYVQAQQESRAQTRLNDDLRARATALEAEIFTHAEATAQANRELLLEIDRRRSAQKELGRETDKLTDANAALLAMQRSREQLTGMIVHDLRNPLTASLGYLDLLTSRLKDAEPTVRGWLKHSTTVNRSLMAMINDIIDVMRMEDTRMPVRIATVDIVALIDGKLAEYRGAAVRNGLVLSYQGPARLGFATDGTLLGRVLDNLVVNAIKHTHAGGSVTICARHQAKDKRLVLKVRDSGEGIAPADLERLFQKYGRVEGQALGRTYDTGLGLVFCRMATDLLQGAIRVESTLGKGTTFIIELQA